MPIDLEKLRELCDKATAGPWEIRFGGLEGDDGFCVASRMTKDLICESWPITAKDTTLSDGHFIAASREALPELLRRLAKIEELTGPEYYWPSVPQKLLNDLASGKGESGGP